jgi:hypothetical protein
MFGKRKKQALYNVVDDSRSIVNDFRLRTSEIGFESYRTVEYRLYHKLREEEMLPILDDHLTKLFSGEVDDGNANMLDAIIFGAAREAQPDLGRQRYDHIDMLRRLTVSRIADREDIRRIKAEREKERDAIQDDYERICCALKKFEEV